MDQQWTHQDFLTSLKLSSKMKKFVPQKIASTNTKKDIFQSYRDQNPKPKSLLNSQHTHNLLTYGKNSAAIFKDVKTEEAFSNQDQKLVETTNLWRQLFSNKKSPQRKSTSATIAKPIELRIGTTMNTSRFLNEPHTVLKN